MSLTSTVLMVRPCNFGFSEQAAESNAFMQDYEGKRDPQADALLRFDLMVKTLKDHDIEVLTIEDTPTPFTPDSIFPNNWFSTHEDGRLIYYPMEVINRRSERSPEVLEGLLTSHNFEIRSKNDLSPLENEGIYLEGTGSLVLDRFCKKAYACLSSRTQESALRQWNELFPDYELIVFNASFGHQPIYHTNVLMTIASDFAVICLESITKNQEREMVRNKILESGKKIIEISGAQMAAFAGNMLQLKNKNEKKFFVMSQKAFDSLTQAQLEEIEELTTIISVDLGLIETIGGGSARCMIAEIFLPRLNQ